mgnify:CR=1 FL=1|jgi:hypothetical protein
MRKGKKKARNWLLLVEVASWLAGIISAVLELIKFTRGN